MKHGCVAVALTRLGAAFVTGLLIASCSGNAGNPASPDGMETPGEWRVWTDEDYRFHLRYPRDLVVLPEPHSPPAGGPRSLRRVRFQDQKIAAGAFADREPARFSVEVFDNRQRESLSAWLKSHGRLPSGATVTSVDVAGAQEALKIALRQMLAPNEFVYVASDRYVYALTPLGEHAEEMLASFRLIESKPDR